ncbi:MAG TPA: phosphoenolpyruvate-utilizing N-terminal domain-containing protein, partial [Buchnera sp. (in: enterobacteria)]|nr:phosphoenolpyruvate-utilizing N-terminal domain-containing protein [Buchnera sp. (in: enterobacteria)]
MISGILASPGIAIGKALLLKEEKIIINQKNIDSNKIEQEINRFFYGRKKTLIQLQKIQSNAIVACEKEKSK